jgi:hypothetical protein
VNQKLFNILLQPLEAVMASMSEIIDHKCNSQKLFFSDFVNKLLFGYIYPVSSLRNLVLELETNDMCRALDLTATPFSTLKDGFLRFDSKYFKQIFESVLERTVMQSVPDLEEMGSLRVIDGSLFPTLVSMSWTSYRKAKNAFKLHLSFDLNRMIPAEFWVGTGKSSERKFLESIVKAGVTYIADRGYFSFELMAKISQMEAFFVMRIKDNVIYQTLERLPIAFEELPHCFKQVKDEIVIFTNDNRQKRYRLIGFEVVGSKFRIATNRFELSTLQIIVLYAYRWQIELFFKFIKRTLKGIHLFNHSENGVEIQFYLLMILAVLMLKLKQDSSTLEEEMIEDEEEKAKKKEEKRAIKQESPQEWIKENAKIFYKSWKISKNWLTVLKNSLAKVLDNKLLRLLNSS